MAEPQHRSGAPLWGVAAEFESEEGVLTALRDLRGRDLGRLDAYSPVPIPGAASAMNLRRRHLFAFAAAAAAVGAAAMFGMCTYATVFDYKFDIGGRPLFSWPYFIVPSVSFGTLTGALAVFLITTALSRLPRLNHPAFNINGFTRATKDRFFVAVEARDDSFDADRVEAAIAALPIRPLNVSRVPR